MDDVFISFTLMSGVPPTVPALPATVAPSLVITSYVLHRRWAWRAREGYGLILVIFEPCTPAPAIRPCWPKTNA